MPRLLAQIGVVPNTELMNTLYEGIELAGCLYVVESGMLDNMIENKNMQIALMAGAYTYYDRMVVPDQ